VFHLASPSPARKGRSSRSVSITRAPPAIRWEAAALGLRGRSYPWPIAILTSSVLAGLLAEPAGERGADETERLFLELARADRRGGSPPSPSRHGLRRHRRLPGAGLFQAGEVAAHDPQARPRRGDQAARGGGAGVASVPAGLCPPSSPSRARAGARRAALRAVPRRRRQRAHLAERGEPGLAVALRGRPGSIRRTTSASWEASRAIPSSSIGSPAGFETRPRGRSKALHRLILSSATWQEAVHFDPLAAAVDPDDRLLWRRIAAGSPASRCGTRSSVSAPAST
jgi:hypothetical protein